MNNCPKCGAPLQENARFCPHCMTQFGQKQTIEKPKVTANKKKKALYIIIAVLLVLSVSGSGFGIYYRKAHSPICSFQQFEAAVPVASEKMGINDLWEEKSFIDARYLKKQKALQYTTDVYLNGASLSVFFYNKGEQVIGYITDVKPDDYSKAESLLKCVVQSTCNYYFTDIDKVFDNENVYPKSQLKVPFDPDYTDLLSRTEQYNGDIKNGADISTKYILMENDGITVAYFVTERNTSGVILYDLYVNIMRS